MPFYYTDPELKFPATQQVSEREWVLELPFWHIHPKTGKRTYIPAGGIGPVDAWIDAPAWKTDYRSGPAIVDTVVPKEGAYSAAWLKHDFGYATEAKPRRVLDWELLEDLQELGANWFQRNTVWTFVRVFGAKVWADHNPKAVRALRAYAAQVTPA